MKAFLKIILFLVVAVVIVVGGYIIYVFSSFYRLDDNLDMPVIRNVSQTPETDYEYSIVSYNIGFGAYSDDYSFFMDDGEYSRAFSEEAVHTNISGAMDEVIASSPDIVCIQEVDFGSTRSYQVDERELIYQRLSNYNSVFAQNYDSPYLFYPISEPHGKSRAGIMTLSKFDIDSAIRHSLPIEDTFMKLVDLDRCYSVSRIPVSNGKELCLYNLHLSAYSSDGNIATQQVELLFEDMQAEYASGNYIIATGDFNKDLLGDSSKIFGISGEAYTWAQSFPFELVPKDFDLIAPLDQENPVPSVRNPNAPYAPEVAFVLTVDGFIVSDNVTVSKSGVIDSGFKWSDHNPVYLSFTLAE